MASFAAKALFDLSGRVAVVTGGGTGIGYMIARGLASNGAKVYIAARKEAQLKAVRLFVPLTLVRIANECWYLFRPPKS